MKCNKDKDLRGKQSTKKRKQTATKTMKYKIKKNKERNKINKCTMP